jgi:hypothetical protein
MDGLLPDAVRLRPKTAFAADPVAMRRTISLDGVVRILRAAPELDRFVDADRLRRPSAQRACCWTANRAHLQRSAWPCG